MARSTRINSTEYCMSNTSCKSHLKCFGKAKHNVVIIVMTQDSHTTSIHLLNAMNMNITLLIAKKSLSWTNKPNVPCIHLATFKKELYQIVHLGVLKLQQKANGQVPP